MNGWYHHTPNASSHLIKDKTTRVVIDNCLNYSGKLISEPALTQNEISRAILALR